jgi:hypothetical protein
MKTYGAMDVYIHTFLTSALVGGEWSASRPCRFTPGERAPGIHSTGGWVGPRAGLDEMEKWKFLTLPGLELRPLGRPARNQSLYRLRYPGSSRPARSQSLYWLRYPGSSRPARSQSLYWLRYPGSPLWFSTLFKPTEVINFSTGALDFRRCLKSEPCYRQL